MRRVACLHTAESNVAVFDDALGRSGLRGIALGHTVRADLLADAERAGGVTPEIAVRTADALRGLCASADAVLLTCSTLGPAAEAAAAGAPVPVLRVDEALARRAVAAGGRVVVLCAVETTVDPTRRLFERVGSETGAEVVVALVPGAWDAFRSGDRERYWDMIARSAEAAEREGAACVALAQASMAAAADRARTDRRPLDSPSAGLAAAAAI
ncbi:aspartate/glutamate racemase family protein [Methylobacterium sp. NEAU 140]|uniref:aspartate/glutamate racemase family protein n=1 Tax=Methylobacterium sp. NEAU 140 TaxID=3064945 RepID=UPI0027339EBF|nr:aspartate/glutamate racemase family protein [Methylobacterium sp. NEAU 140]MDP4024988.1 aspartate/glutamate racemase family protein [Methylobacterium sp. NEAU 140]